MPSDATYRGAPTGRAREYMWKGGHEPTMTKLFALISSFRNDDEGQGLAEYALILALIAIVAIIALIFLGSQVSSILSVVGYSI